MMYSINAYNVVTVKLVLERRRLAVQRYFIPYAVGFWVLAIGRKLTAKGRKRNIMETTPARSEYETERGKPAPGKNHSIVQGSIYFLLRQKYEERYRVLPEVSVLIDEKDRIPDLTTIYVFSGPNEYEAYVKKGTLKDPHLDIELDVEAIFR